MVKNSLQLAWSWRLESSPESFWPLLADTDRFNRETGLPPLVPISAEGIDLAPGSRLLAVKVLGFTQRWVEEGFEWLEPRRFSVDRRFLGGPLARMKAWARLEALPGGGSRLLYGVDLVPRHVLLKPLIALVARLAIPRRFGPVFRRFDAAARAGTPAPPAKPRIAFAPGGLARLSSRTRELLEAGADPDLASRLKDLLLRGDGPEVARLRPYVLADAWGVPRRRVLELCLQAARAGILDFRWDLLCPSCRGPKGGASRLSEVRSPVHCETCRIDFKAAFDRSVEVTFRPNAALRPADAAEYCVGGPRKTPHLSARLVLEAGAEAALDLALEPGRWRLRPPSLPGALHVRAALGGEAAPLATPGPGGWVREEAHWSPSARLMVQNQTGRAATFLLERTAWADDAATGAEVTALQAFRDLFAEEALRPGEEISVGRLAFLFTDLRGSTRLYREVGDAKAFGLVMEHFDHLKAAIAAEGGAVVKTIGDAVLAVFPSPLSAVRAALESQRLLDEKLQPLVLKAGVHCGACIAVNQNGRLDYFGSTLNLAARLLGFCSGGDLVVTKEAASDPETANWLEQRGGGLAVEDMEVEVRGFAGERFALRRLKAGIRPADRPLA
jgi:class 3 adenylate cyclase